LITSGCGVSRHQIRARRKKRTRRAAVSDAVERNDAVAAEEGVHAETVKQLQSAGLGPATRKVTDTAACMRAHAPRALGMRRTAADPVGKVFQQLHELRRKPAIRKIQHILVSRPCVVVDNTVVVHEAEHLCTFAIVFAKGDCCIHQTDVQKTGQAFARRRVGWNIISRFARDGAERAGVEWVLCHLLRERCAEHNVLHERKRTEER